ncbi:MAG: hypothetical protein H0U80_04925, partial [Solirubrobacterales bacterium]|nr:hypothetical protein [Solirubrobacterales bacterium]
MLFDLRSPGRRRIVKTVYVTLALLMGGGLVLFGIGGEVSGGVVDAITGTNGGGDDGSDRFEEREERALAATRADPEDAAAWGELARARFQLASVGDNVNAETGTFTADGRTKLRQATAAWEKHVEVADEPDDRLAAVIAQAYIQLGEPAKAAGAQEVITEARPRAGVFAQLAVYAYAAGQTRRGDLARDRALELTDRE